MEEQLKTIRSIVENSSDIEIFKTFKQITKWTYNDLLNIRMSTMFMNSESSSTSYVHRLKIRFRSTNTKRYVLLATLPTKDSTILLKHLNSGFRKTTNEKICKSKV